MRSFLVPVKNNDNTFKIVNFKIVRCKFENHQVKSVSFKITMLEIKCPNEHDV